MKNKTKILIITGCLSSILSLNANAENIVISPQPEEKNVVTLEATATKDVEQDFVTVYLENNQQDLNNEKLKENLTKQTKEGIAFLKKNITDKDDITPQTSSFNIYPVYDHDQKNLKGWEGRSSIMITGKSVNKILDLSTQISDFNIKNVSFSVSPQLYDDNRDTIIESAIEKFKNQADLVARNFGMKKYTIKNINIRYNDDGIRPMPVMRLAVASMKADRVENGSEAFSSGKATISATVNGSIQLEE